MFKSNKNQKPKQNPHLQWTGEEAQRYFGKKTILRVGKSLQASIRHKYILEQAVILSGLRFAHP